MIVERAVARVDAPSARAMRALFEARIPVVASGLMSGWRAMSTWSAASLASSHGAVIVPVQRWSSRSFGTLRHERMTLGRYLELYEAGACDGLHFSGHPLFRDAPALRSDIEMPPGVDRLANDHPLIFVSPEGVVTPLHHDVCHNVYAQISGRKRFLLVSPSQSPILRQRPSSWWTSSVDLESERDRAAAELASLRVEQVDLSPGEMLIIPGGYWHHVRALERGIALGFFFEHGLRQRLLRRALALVGRPAT